MRRPRASPAVARASPVMDLFNRRRRRDEADDFGFGRDIDGPLSASERDNLYLWPLIFALVSWVTLGLFGSEGLLKFLVPDNANIFSWILPCLVLWATWDLPSERK